MGGLLRRCECGPVLASFKVGEGTHAYPVVAGNRIFIKDKDSVALLTIP